MSMDQIRASTDQGILLPAARLVQDLILTFLPSSEKETELLRQVDLAHQKLEVGWLRSHAWEAQEGWGQDWIVSNIGPMPSQEGS